MGFRFRKSINLGGGTRINLSKSGVGVSTGVKGFRVSHNSSGRSRVTASLPGTGVSYVKEYGSSSGRSSGSSYSGGGHSSGGSKPPILQRTWVLILSMMFFPPLAIYLMWRYRGHWSKAVRIVLTVILAGYTLILAAACAADEQPVEDPPVTNLEEQIITPDPTPEPETIPDPTPQPTPEPEPEPVYTPDPGPETRTVYITETGEKYHDAGCRWIEYNKIPIDLDDAIAQGYTACGTCGG